MYSWAARYDSVTHVQLCSELNANQSANIALLALSHCPCEIVSYLQSGYFLKSDLPDTFHHELALEEKPDHENFAVK